jgi:hypothetical protein
LAPLRLGGRNIRIRDVSHGGKFSRTEKTPSPRID